MKSMKINAVTGIDAVQVKRDLVLAGLASVGLLLDTSNTTEFLTMQLWLHYTNTLPIDRQMRCLVCRGIGDVETDTCPYCGAEEGEAVEAAPAPPPPEPVASTAIVDIKPKKQKLVKVKVERDGGPIVIDDTRPSSEILTERELNTAVADVFQLKADGAVAFYKFGRRILDIFDGSLWKLRTEVDAKGKAKPRWSSWEAFCVAELNMTPKSANAAMDNVRNFTEDQIRLCGRKKLELTLLVPREEREPLMKQIEEGASKREIEIAVKKIREDLDYTRPQRETPPGGLVRNTEAATKAAAEIRKLKRAQKEPTITVAALVGNQTVKLYKKPPSLKMKPDFDIIELPRAKLLSDFPFGRMELTNDVTMWFSVQESPSGELILKIAIKREDGE